MGDGTSRATRVADLIERARRDGSLQAFISRRVDDMRAAERDIALGVMAARANGVTAQEYARAVGLQGNELRRIIERYGRAGEARQVRGQLAMSFERHLPGELSHGPGKQQS